MKEKLKLVVSCSRKLKREGYEIIKILADMFDFFYLYGHQDLWFK